jgi:hypothetical protein
MSDAIRNAFRQQAAGCRAMNSPLTAEILETLADTLDHSSRTGARILDWPGDPMADALKLRIAGGLHALARSDEDPESYGVVSSRNRRFCHVLIRVLKEWDDWLYPWLDSPPQTNEVGRSAALMAGLMVAAQRLDMPIELLELGSSAGLNLNLDRFRYNLGRLEAGPNDAAVRIMPEWNGHAPGPMAARSSRAAVSTRIRSTCAMTLLPSAFSPIAGRTSTTGWRAWRPR